MKIVSNEYKENIKKFGRELDSLITYKNNGEVIELGVDELNSITPSFESSLLKSCMKQLIIDSNVDIPVKTMINYHFGVFNGEEYDYIDYGDYRVVSSEYKADTRSYEIKCYDLMINSMNDYHGLKTAQFPMSVKKYLTTLCHEISLEFENENDNFVNSNRIINSDPYVDLGYTYRDIFDELSQVTASTICVNGANKVEVRYINDTNELIDEDYLKDTNINMGEKYGPINSIVLSRSAGADNVYIQDERSISENGLHELKISDNQIMNFNDRNDYLPEILAKLNGLEYYTNDFVSVGITYLELCDRYIVQIEDKQYPCIMLNDEAIITQGLVENIHADIPENSETDYSKSDKTDRKINQTYLIVDKQNQKIEAVVSQTEGQNQKIAQIQLSVDELNSKISDVADITVSAESSYASVELLNVNESEPVYIKVRPILENISYIYPQDNLYPSDNLFMTPRHLKITNTNTNESQLHEIPADLLYLDENTYDEYVLSYENHTCIVTKRCEYVNQNINVNDNLSGKRLYLNFPNDLEGINYYGGLINSEKYSIVELFSNDEFRIILRNIDTFETVATLYHRYGDNVADINLKEYVLPNDFGIVTNVIKDNEEVYESYGKDYDYIKFFNGKIGKKAKEEHLSYLYPEILLKDGNYRVDILNHNNGYLYVTMMAKNIYTTQFYTKAETNSVVAQTANSINLNVNQKLSNYSTAEETNAKIELKVGEINQTVSRKVGKNEVISSINQSPETIKLNASKINLTGYVTATDLSGTGTTTINGSNIKTGTIDASKVSVTNLNASNITTGTFSANRISGGTISGNNVSVTNLNASNLSGGTMSSANISIDNGSGFLRMLAGSAYNPYVSALNVSNKSNGISFRNSNTAGNAGSQIATVHTESQNLILDANGNILIGGSSMAGGAVGVWSGYLHAGNMSVGENYINNSNGGQLAINQSISLNPSSGAGAYVGGVYANNRIQTVGGSPSSLSVKENVKEKDLSDIPEILRNMKLYDYKYINEIENGKKDYGYIIDYLEQIPNIKKYFNFYDAHQDNIKYKQIEHERIEKFMLGALIQQQSKIDELEKMIYNLEKEMQNAKN